MEAIIKKNMKRLNFIVIIILFITAACSNDEPLIDNSITDVSFIIQRKINTLEVLNFRGNPTLTDIELGIDIGKIDLMKKFREKYYLINKSLRSVFVLEDIDNPIITTINFINPADSNLVIKDICFPNATDCYVIFDNASIVRIIDLTTNQLTNVEIELPDVASSIAGIGNQVYVTIPNRNLVIVIDTRINSIVSQITISNRPTFVDFSHNGRHAIVISVGEGKSAPPYNNTTSAMISTIDLGTKNVLRNNILTNSAETASKLIPNAMIVFDRFIYISAENIDGGAGGYRISTTNYSTTNAIVRTPCDYVVKNWNNLLFIVKNASQEINCLLFAAGNNRNIKELNIGFEFYSACEK